MPPFQSCYGYWIYLCQARAKTNVGVPYQCKQFCRLALTESRSQRNSPLSIAELWHQRWSRSDRGTESAQLATVDRRALTPVLISLWPSRGVSATRHRQSELWHQRWSRQSRLRDVKDRYLRSSLHVRHFEAGCIGEGIQLRSASLVT